MGKYGLKPNVRDVAKVSIFYLFSSVLLSHLFYACTVNCHPHYSHFDSVECVSLVLSRVPHHNIVISPSSEGCIALVFMSEGVYMYCDRCYNSSHVMGDLSLLVQRY